MSNPPKRRQRYFWLAYEIQRSENARKIFCLVRGLFHEDTKTHMKVHRMGLQMSSVLEGRRLMVIAYREKRNNVDGEDGFSKIFSLGIPLQAGLGITVCGTLFGMTNTLRQARI